MGGWVRSIRASKAFGFIVLSDGTYFNPLQVVYHDTMENFQAVSKLNVGTALIVKGTLVETPDAKQPFELQATAVTVEGASTPDYPLQKKRHSLEFLRTMTPPAAPDQHLPGRVPGAEPHRLRHPPVLPGAGLRLRPHPPDYRSDCEGAGEMFQVTTLDLNNLPRTEDGKVDFTQDFFNKPTNLTVSGPAQRRDLRHGLPQHLHLRPTFRAENSNTTRHAAEFWMIEPEIAFADLQDDMRLAEDMIKYIISFVLEKAPEEMPSSTSLWTRACWTGCTT